MDIDVVIPLYNGAPYLADTLTSVLNQTVKPGRIVVVDDGSTDNSPDIAAQIPGITCVKNPRKGPAHARNFGFRFSGAPYIAFLDQDDLWHPSHLERLAHILELFPDADVAASGIRSFRHGGTPAFDLHDISLDLFNPWDIFPTHDFACTPSMTLFRREAFRRAGGWSVEHSEISDYSLWMRLALEKPIVRTKARSVAYRRRPDSLTAQLLAVPSHYMDFSVEVDNDLMHDYLRSWATEEDKRRVQKRFLNAVCLSRLLQGLVRDDHQGLRENMIFLEDNLKEEQYGYIKSLFIYLFYMHKGFCSGKTIEEMNLCYAHLLDTVPASARVIRQVLTELLVRVRPGLHFYLEYYFKKPHQFERLCPLKKAIDHKLALLRQPFTGIR